MSDYVIGAYTITVLLLGGYALSVLLRQRATERDLAILDDEG